MHELAIARSILRIVEDHARREGVARVKKVSVRIGGFSCVEPSSLTFCFDALKKGTVASAAFLEVDKEPVKGLCSDCGGRFEVEGFVFSCPICRGRRFRVTGDDEMRVLYMEVD